MRIYLKYLCVSLFMLCTIPELSGQPFSLDNSFQSTYQFMDPVFENEVGAINRIIEMEDGTLRLSGGFDDPNDLYEISHIVKLSPNGVFNPSFNNIGASVGISGIYKYLPYIYWYCRGGGGHIGRVNAETAEIDMFFYNNKDSSNWLGGNNMYLLPNGDFLVSGWIEYHYGLPDAIGSAIARIDKDGFYDTTFHHDASGPIGEFLKYDTNRVLITGTFEAYDNVPRHRAARIFNDGSIDTSFHSIFTGGSSLRPLYVQPDGKIIMGGFFYIQGFDKFLGIARLHPDGSLDSTFNNFNNVQSESGLLQTITAHEQYYHVNTCCLTPENKYLFGGGFRYCQGKYRGRIVQTDYNGFLDTTVFMGSGIDTCIGPPEYLDYLQVHCIIPAQNNKYYVAGNFSGFNGQMTEPIIRLNPHDHVGIEEQQKKKGLLVYPNPVKETLSISAGFMIEEVEIYNLSGSRVLKHQLNNTRKAIEISNLPQGRYILRATGKNDVWIEKFLVVR